MSFINNWKALQREFDYIQGQLASERNRVRKRTPPNIQNADRLTTARINQIKAEVHAEETHCWTNHK